MSLTSPILSSPRSLDQWNCEQQAIWDERVDKIQHPERYPNGLICPLDGGKLYDTMQKYLGPPPLWRVKCMNPDCTFVGKRIERINRTRCD